MIQVPSYVRIARNQTPVRAEFIDGRAMWRGVPDFEHATLCRIFGLDPASFYFDLPSSCRGIGSNMTGIGGNRNGRTINGFIMQAGRNEPFGKLTVVLEREKFRDVDPNDKREFYKL